MLSQVPLFNGILSLPVVASSLPLLLVQSQLLHLVASIPEANEEVLKISLLKEGKDSSHILSLDRLHIFIELLVLFIHILGGSIDALIYLGKRVQFPLVEGIQHVITATLDG